ncbi:hypothetical protein MNBD_GAMMA09-1499 [hydrothermal vent metagenome]|uniref:Tripartite ATP-independent periplasmic transporters DctQ component domain-containing protein n=1 Tax=hydrothermal vent metagenome TaxID=652676 RepID=A0A3B0XCH5_9ZZZZ
MTSLSGFIFQVKKTLIHFEKITAGLSLLLLLVLALSQVIMRNIFEIGFSEIDVIARHLVLFITFMGAALATESNQHIKIDCLNSVITPSFQSIIKQPLLFISSAISGVFCWYACQFWLDEQLYAPDNEQLALYLALIIPLGFFILSLHFFLLLLIPPSDQAASE